MKINLKTGIIIIVILISIVGAELTFVFLRGKNNNENNIPNNSSNNSNINDNSNDNPNNDNENTSSGKKFIDVLMTKKCSTTASTITEEEAKNCLVDENGLRYEGKEPNNYVQFNNELWQIIGIFNVETSNGETQNLIKLIRNEYLDDKPIWDEDDDNKWEKPANINTTLNNDYLNSTNDFTSSGINAVKSKIASVKWNVGDASYYNPVATAYDNEIKIQTVNLYKVGLLTTSEYAYGSLAITCDRKTTLLLYSEDGCVNKNWLNKDSKQTENLITPNTYEGINSIDFKGSIFAYHTNGATLIRPVIYLNNDVTILSNTDEKDIGSKTNPYVIE